MFKAIIPVLNPAGHFAFTVEYLENVSYFLQTSGRYAHSSSYVHDLSEKYHVLIESEQNITLRVHEAKTIMGRLFILKNPN